MLHRFSDDQYPLISDSRTKNGKYRSVLPMPIQTIDSLSVHRVHPPPLQDDSYISAYNTSVHYPLRTNAGKR